jgi:two-component system phosphate regulon sensor histidine kinase PhoR
LRSPLTVISGYLDTLVTDAETPEHWRKPVAQMQTQAGRLNNIIAELLELSRLESIESDVGSERINVCGLLAVAKKTFSDEDHLLSISVECQSGDVLLGSVSEIESVITNLLSNAVRHTPSDGAITLTWSGTVEGGQLVVADTGEGIVAEDVPRLTERFFRVNRGRSRDDGGIGLGLAIVKHALSRHDATLEIVSEPGQGSRFICHFPRERMSAADSL